MSSNKIRNALSEASIALSWATHNHLTSGDAEKYLKIVDDALAAQQKNCDVGTPDEQDRRFGKWCRKYGIDGDMEVACAHPDMRCTLCALRWAQMPYEEGEQK